MGKLTISMAIFNSYFDITRGSSFCGKKKGVAELDLLNVMNCYSECQSLPSWELTWTFFGIQIQQIQRGSTWSTCDNPKGSKLNKLNNPPIFFWCIHVFSKIKPQRGDWLNHQADDRLIQVSRGLWQGSPTGCGLPHF